MTLAACTGNGKTPGTDASSTGSTPATQTAIGNGADPASPNPGGDSAGTDETDGTAADLDAQFTAEDIPDAGAIKAAGQGLPSDPAEAASALVDVMFGSDLAKAAAATGELLRRAGFPIGSGAGPMVAMPDHFVITNAQIDTELLPSYTEQVRGGTAFDIDQVQALLAYVGVPQDQFTAEDVIGTLADWGKGADDPAESRTAGAAERALAHQHGQLFAPSDVPDAVTLTAVDEKPESLPLDEYDRLATYPTSVTLDPLQALLLLAHVAGAATDEPEVDQLDPATGAANLRSPSAAFVSEGPCSVVQDPLSTTVGKAGKKVVVKQLQNALKARVKERFGKDAADALGQGFNGYDKFTDVASFIAFIEALHLDVAPSQQSTHFLHDEGPHANDVTFEAHAYIRSVVPKEYAACLGLAGIDIPTDKDLKDMKVIWTLPGGRIGLKPAVVGDRQFDVPILLDGRGKSTVQTTPRREKYPPKDGSDAPQSTVIQAVKASLDKNYLKVHLGDVVKLIAGDVDGAIMSAAYHAIMELIKEASLPSKTVDFPVTYHGSNVYHMVADSSLSIPFYADIPLKADLYSCDGAQGPWQGSISVGGGAGPMLQLAGKLAGYKGPTSGVDVVPVHQFTVNSKIAQLQTFPISDKYGLVVQLDEAAVENGLQTKSGTGKVAERMQRIGWASWTIGGVDVRDLAGIIGGFMSQNLDIPIEAVSGDLRCKDKGTAVYQNDFD